MFHSACEKGDLSGVQAHYDKNSAVKGFGIACKNGHINVVQWLYNLGICYKLDDAFSVACANNHLEITKWLHSLDSSYIYKEDCRPFRRAIINKAIDVAKWIYDLDKSVLVKSMEIMLEEWDDTFDDEFDDNDCSEDYDGGYYDGFDDDCPEDDNLIFEFEIMLNIEHIDSSLLHELGLSNRTIDDLINIQNNRPITITDTTDDIVHQALIKFRLQI